MKITIGADYKAENDFNGTVGELIEKLHLMEFSQDLMFTMTLDQPSSVPTGDYTVVQFRAWTSPFRNFFRGHVNRDGVTDNNVLFEIVGKPEEILEAMKPLVSDKVEWQAVNEQNRKVRLWLSRDISRQ